MATEIIIFPLKDAADLSNSAKYPATEFKSFASKVLSAPGAKYVYYGQSAEHKDTAVILTHWNSKGDQEKWKSSGTYSTAIFQLTSIMAPTFPPTTTLVPLTPADPSAALGANQSVGITELALFYFCTSLSAADKESVEKVFGGLAALGSEFKELAPLAVNVGWADEPVQRLGDVSAVTAPPGKKFEPGHYRAKVHVVGFKDLATHEKLREQAQWKEAAGKIMGIEKLKGLEVNHFKLFRA